MFALPAGLQLGWLLYERARALTGAASHISSWISLLLSDVDGEVRVLLEQLVQRVDALTPALTFALGWSSDKGSAVSDVVFSAKSQLFRVEQFIHHCTKQKGQVKLIDRDWLIRNLHSHIRELDFAIQSVTLCVSLITASRPQQPQSAVVSASALLRASDRLHSMHAQGGDVTCSFGALYTLDSSAVDSSSQQQHQQQHQQQYQHERDNDDDESSEVRSTLPLSTSTFLTDYDHFSIDPDTSSAPAPSQQSTHAPAAGDRGHVHDLQAAASSSSASSVFPSLPPRLPPISSAPICDVRAWLNESIIEHDQPAHYQPHGEPTKAFSHTRTDTNNAHTPPPSIVDRSSTDKADQTTIWRRIVYELHVENLAADPALVDGELLSSPSLSSSSARRLRFDLSSSLSFRCTNSRAIGLAEDEAVKSQSSALLDVCFHWSSQWVNRVQCQYAFMLLDLDVSTHGRQADNLRPLDIAYAARLCCYENQTTRPQHGSHNHATDEELWMLFANHTRPVDESNDQSTQPTSQTDQAPPHVHTAFPAAMLASPPLSSQSSSSSPVAFTHSSACQLAPAAHVPGLSLSHLSPAVVVPVPSPPLDGTSSRTAMSNANDEQRPSPLDLPPSQLPQATGVSSPRSISTSGRRAMTSSFSDLPHFAATDSSEPAAITAAAATAATDGSNGGASRILPTATPVSTDEDSLTRP